MTSIDQLIRDLIVEDTFKSKYTARQRTIFCKNMYEKVAKFLETSFDEEIEKIKDLEEEVAVANNDMEVYKKSYEDLKESYDELNRSYDELNQSYDELNQSYKSIFIHLLASLRLVVYGIYLMAMWQFYKDKLDTSIKDITNTSVVPYNKA
jgi:phage-related tail protein